MPLMRRSRLRAFLWTIPGLRCNQPDPNQRQLQYNSLQTVLKIREWHRFTSQFAYTWAHGLDDMTQYRGTLAQDNFNLKADYGAWTTTPVTTLRPR